MVGWVNDFEQDLSAEQVNDLSKLLGDYSAKKGPQITVVTMSSISPYNQMHEYYRDLGNKWGVGEKGEHNGVVLLYSKALRQVFIGTGLGVEAILTDKACQQIVDNVMVPEFKANKAYEGLKKGVEEIEKVLDSK